MSKLKPTTRQAILIGGDLLVILSFIFAGRSSHGFSMSDIVVQIWLSAFPFIVGWFVIMPWFGIYKVEISRNWRQLTPRLLLGWLIAGSLSQIVRAWFLGRPIPTGIIPTFAMISLAYIGLVALIWRLGYIWWVKRRPKHPQSKVRSAES